MNSHILQILNALENHPSSLNKLAILEAEKANVLLQKVLIATLDPYTTYFIAKIPGYIQNVTGTLDLTDAIDQLDSLSNRNVTGHAGIAHLAYLLGAVHEDDAIVLQRIIKGDLRCGVSTSTINKIWPKLISVYPCLLAEKNDPAGKNMANIKFPCYSDLKADGMRANVFCRPDINTIIRGRSGKRADLLGHLESAFDNYKDLNIVIDGELIVLEEDGSIMPRKKGNGLLNKAIKGTMTEDIAKRVRIRVWDIIPFEEFDGFQDRKYTVPYSERRAQLYDVFKGDQEAEFARVLADNDKISIIPSKIINNFDEAQEHFEEMIAAGEEGTILKNFNHIWENKRSKGQVKMKAVKDCDLEVIGWNPGTVGTKLEGKMGSLICVSSDRKVEVNISGFEDALRQEIFENFDTEWKGRIVAVKYNERIQSKQAGREHVDSLFLPRFQELREDKSTADTSTKIL